MDDSIPEPIARIMERRGLTKQRGSGPGMGALAAAAGVHKSTVRNFLDGRTPQRRTVEKIAKALGVSVAQLQELRGEPASEVYVGPDASRTMTARERAALTEFILATIEARKAVTHDDRETSIDELSQRRALTDEELLREAERQPHAASHGEEGIGPSDDPEEGP